MLTGSDSKLPGNTSLIKNHLYTFKCPEKESFYISQNIMAIVLQGVMRILLSMMSRRITTTFGLENTSLIILDWRCAPCFEVMDPF
jgi:hypothetical protein